MNSPRSALLILGLVAALGVAACAAPPKQYDTDSGGDENRKTARKLFPGQNVTDSLDDPGGDHTDWKEIRIRENGRLGLTVALDDTRGVEGFISIKDGFGVELERRPISPADNLYNFDKLPVYQGEYYIQVFLETGKTTYTVGAVFDPDNKGGAVVAVPFEEAPDPGGRRNTGGGTGGGVAVKTNPGGNPGEGSGNTSPPDDKNVTVQPDKGGQAEEDDANFTSLRGRIARLVPLDDGGTQLIISGFGAADGVTAGMSGVIVGLGQSFRVTQVRANGATALTSADADALGPYKTVLLKVKRQ